MDVLWDVRDCAVVVHGSVLECAVAVSDGHASLAVSPPPRTLGSADAPHRGGPRVSRRWRRRPCFGFGFGLLAADPCQRHGTVTPCAKPDQSEGTESQKGDTRGKTHTKRETRQWGSAGGSRSVRPPPSLHKRWKARVWAEDAAARRGAAAAWARGLGAGPLALGGTGASSAAAAPSSESDDESSVVSNPHRRSGGIRRESNWIHREPTPLDPDPSSNCKELSQRTQSDRLGPDNGIAGI